MLYVMTLTSLNRINLGFLGQWVLVMVRVVFLLFGLVKLKVLISLRLLGSSSSSEESSED